MYNISELTTNCKSDYPDNFTTLQNTLNACAIQNYQSEIHLIDEDQNLSAKDKIKLRRNALLFFFAATATLYFAPQIFKCIENRIPA